MRRDWNIYLYYLHVIPFSPSTNVISQIPTVKVYEIEFRTTYPNFPTIQRLMNLGSYFYRDIFGFLRENKRLPCEEFSSKLRHDFEIPNGENTQNWVANLVLKFHDDPMVNDSEIIAFLRYVWWSAGKEGYSRPTIYLFLLFYKKTLFYSPSNK